MSKFFANFTLFTLLFIVSVLSGVSAQSLEQIEQFQRLPKAQQERLAREMGIDLSAFMNLGNASTSIPQNQENNRVYPRGTEFDEYGNPLLTTNDVAESELFEEESSELKLYGIDLFASSPSTFSPTSDVPVPANYIISPGDELVVQLYGKENEEFHLRVGRDGNIVIPRLGPLLVATKSFSEAKSFVTQQIKKQIIGVEVSLTMGELSTMRVFVLGEAYKPGAYNVSSLSTITHALFVSGGVSEIASLRNIQLKRAGKLVATLDLYDLLNSGDTRNDALLQPGDAIFIPALARTVKIDGQVRRPAIYELKHEDSLSDVIKLAGGKLPTGFETAIGIKRYINGSQIQLTANLKNGDLNILNGDYITVPEVSSFVSGSIKLIGAVARPGSYQWHENIRISNLLSEPSRDLLEHADLSYVLVLREINKRRDIEVLQVDLSDVEPDQNILLKPNDNILVFSKMENELLADIHLEEMAYGQEELEVKENQRWQRRIEEKLFWKNVGIVESNTSSALIDNEDYLLQNQPIIQLTEDEIEQVLELKDFGFFSRKRMLKPVINKLQEQARHGHPLQLVEIAGEVKVPGLYPLSRNANIKSLIVAAGGLTESSYMKVSEVTRSEIGPEGVAQVNHISFSPLEALEALEGHSDIKLQSKDRINIFSVPSWQEELKITVKGEVEFPGEYTIKRGETISDLLVRVGNLTTYGDADAVVFTREILKAQEKQNLNRLAEELRKQIASESLRRNNNAGSIVSYDEAKKLLRDLTSVDAVGRLVIDMRSILLGDASADVVLEDGDVLYVPSRSQSINVIGEVYVPTSHLYSSGLTYEEYIQKSGGFKTLADEKKTYIIRANGAVYVPERSREGFWFGGNDNNSEGILPGDTIVVPFDTDNVDNMTIWANATQIVYQLAVAVAAIGSL